MRTRFLILLLILPTIAEAQVTTFANVVEREKQRKTSAAVAGSPGGIAGVTNTNNNRDFSALIAALETFSQSGGEAVTLRA